MEEKRLPPDSMRCKGALVQVRKAIRGALGTEYFVPTQALVAMETRIVKIAPACAITTVYAGPD